MTALRTLKNLASLTRGAVKDARKVIDEVANNLARGSHPPQPVPVKVPIKVRAPNRSPVFNHPFNNVRGSRTFSSAAIARNQLISERYPAYHQQLIKSRNLTRQIPRNFGTQFWPYSAFRRPLSGRGPFPNGLYRNFYGLNSRNFSTYGASFSREAIQNLTTSLRCFLNNAGKVGLDMMNGNGCGKSSKASNAYLSYHGCASQAQASKTFELAKFESTGIQKLGCHVEFQLPSVKLEIPSISFIDSEILDTMESQFVSLKAAVDKINANLQLIFDTHGSLPMEKRRNSVRVHFPNMDVAELEKLLAELGIVEGLVIENEALDVCANNIEPDSGEVAVGIASSKSSYGKIDSQYGEAVGSQCGEAVGSHYGDAVGSQHGDAADSQHGDAAEFFEKLEREGGESCSTSSPSNMSAYSYKSFEFPEFTESNAESRASERRPRSDYEGIYYPVLSDMESEATTDSSHGFILLHNSEQFNLEASLLSY